MSGFIEWLDSLNAKDTRVRAVLRRSLAFDPGAFVPAYPYVEPFLKGENNFWRRNMLYLVAGLWAAHWREGRRETPMTIGKACAAHRAATGARRVVLRAARGVPAAGPVAARAVGAAAPITILLACR